MVHSAAVGVGLPGHRSPSVGFEAPFEMLSACHERVERMLALLVKLRHHLSENGWDTHASKAATDVIRYFDIAAPHHHLDEEMHVFPVVLALHDTTLDALVLRLKQDHIEMEKSWVVVKHLLASVVNTDANTWVAFSDADNGALDAFAAAYNEHINQEELDIYPAAKRASNSDQLDAMSHEMMRRRGQTGVSSNQ
jgi:hemerythrin-like domain-containing protein